MSLDEGLSRFIGRIYEAVYDADAWRQIMTDVMAMTESRMAFVSSVDLRHQEYSKTAFFAPDKSCVADGIREYGEEFYAIDPSLIWASRHPNAGVCDTAELMVAEDYRKLPYVVWNTSRFGTEHWRVFYTAPVDGLSFALSLHPPTEVGAAPKALAPLHQLLFEHMERALRLASRPPDLTAVGDAVMILDGSGRVLSMSPHAEQLVNLVDGLTVERRRLSADSPGADARLQSAIASAITSKSLGGAGGGVRLSRRSGKTDWLALVSPCPHFLEHLPVGTPAAVLRIVDTDPKVMLSLKHAELFDLSPREMEVADALLGGHSLESLCHLLGISRNTAKVHLQSLFRKTGTNRQSELVHLLSDVVRS